LSAKLNATNKCNKSTFIFTIFAIFATINKPPLRQITNSIVYHRSENNTTLLFQQSVFDNYSVQKRFTGLMLSPSYQYITTIKALKVWFNQMYINASHPLSRTLTWTSSYRLKQW